MNRFNDKYLHNIDGKGRLLLSRELRTRFKMKRGDSLHVLPNVGKPPYMEIRTENQWSHYRENILSQASSEQKRNFLRFVKLMCEVVTMDAQGRIVLPQRIRDLCDLASEVAVINMDLYVEVWNKANVDKKYPDMVKAFREINDLLF